MQEGGKLTFTTTLQRQIDANDPKRVWIARYSAIGSGGSDYNEHQSNPAGMNFAEHESSYVRIDGGNTINETLDLRQQDDTAIKRLAGLPVYSEMWASAFIH